jgi:8-oxo-dGTP diphosphatase
MNSKTSKVIITDHNKKILMLKNSWKEWELPGGHADKRESYINCAKREVYEETGVRIINIERVKIIDQCTIFYSVINKRPNVKLSSEHIKYKWVALDEIENMKISRRSQDYIDIIIETVNNY